MFYNPIIAEIEKWIRKQGGKVYWAWTIICGLILSIALSIIGEHGLIFEAKILIVIFLAVWLGGGGVAGVIEGRKQK